MDCLIIVEKNYHKNANLIDSKIMSMFEKITNKANNTLLHLLVIRLVDKIFTNEWYPIEDKDPWNLIYSANYFFDLPDIFHETFIAQRIVDFGKNMLLKMLADK